MQPPATSAVCRALYPEQFDLSASTQRLDKLVSRIELLAVILWRADQMATAKPGSKVKLAATFDEVAGDRTTTPTPAVGRETPLLTTDEIDALMGWGEVADV